VADVDYKPRIGRDQSKKKVRAKKNVKGGAETSLSRDEKEKQGGPEESHIAQHRAGNFRGQDKKARLDDHHSSSRGSKAPWDNRSHGAGSSAIAGEEMVRSPARSKENTNEFTKRKASHLFGPILD